MRQHFAVGLDGVLLRPVATGPDMFGPAVPGATQWVRRMIKRGHQMTIFTRREQVGMIQMALVNRGFPPLPVITVMMESFTCIIDACAPGFSPEMLQPEYDSIWEEFQPWWKKKAKV